MKCLYCGSEYLIDDGSYPAHRSCGIPLLKCLICGMRFSLFRLLNIKN